MQCYLCGTALATTRDHIPPKGFFPEPRPSNLLTVPCCEACNRSASLDDEALRVWLTAPENISEAGRWIQEHKVFARTLKNSPRLLANARKSVRVVKDGERTLELIDFPQDRADRFFIRLTKGLLDVFYPEVDRQKLVFRMSNLTYATSGWSQFAELRDASIYDSRGDGVFQFRHRVDRATGMGYWFFVFYEASLFSVWHQKGEPGATANLDNAQRLR